MSQFTEFTSVEIPSKFCKNFRLSSPLVFEKYFEGSGEFVIVPAGFETDFASIPWILQWFFKPHDRRWNKPAIVHDYEWEKATTLKEFQDANDNFYQGIIATGTPVFLAKIAYVSVSISKYAYWIRKRLFPKIINE